MKKINIYLFALLSLLFTLVACDKDNEGAIYSPTDEGVTFSAAKHSITEPASKDHFEVYIMRANTKGALELPINVVGTYADLFTSPTKATFADGKGIDTIRFYFGEEVEIGEAYQLTISFDEKYTSDITKATNSLVVTFQRDFEFEAFGTGNYHEYTLGSPFGIGISEYNVELEKAIGFEVYRMVNPYGYKVNPYVEESEVKVDPCYIMIDARDVNAVFIPLQIMGIDWGYGTMRMGSTYGNLTGIDITNEPLGTRVGKTINFGNMYLSLSGYNPMKSSGSKLILP